MSEIKDNVRETDNCFVCGKANEHGLQLDFEKQGNKVITNVSFDNRYEGYPDVVHGGLISAVLDEIMAKWMELNGGRGVTAELTVRFKKPLYVNKRVNVEAELEAKSNRIYNLVAKLIDEKGTIIATGKSRFILMSK